MTSTTTAVPPVAPGSVELADRLRHWFTGAPTVVSGLVVLDEDAARPVGVPADAVVLHPRDRDDLVVDVPSGQAVAYDGVLAYGGGEISVGDDLIVQLEGYATAQYVSVACPTVVSVLDDVDREVLVDDARAAVETGAFPHHLVHPLVLVRDELAWLGAGTGLSDDDAALLRGPDGVAVRRFLAAARVLRALRGRTSGTLTVDGFASGPFAAHGTHDAGGTVVVVRDESSAFVAHAVTGRVSRVSADVADAVSHALVGAALDDALTERLGGPVGVAAVLAALGVDADVADGGAR